MISEHTANILIDFAKHLNESGILKKNTAISSEVKYYLENKLVKKVKCGRCSGKGKHPGFPMENIKCPDCKGEGTVVKYRYEN